MLEKVGIIRGY